MLACLLEYMLGSTGIGLIGAGLNWSQETFNFSL